MALKASTVLVTVNAPYGTSVSAVELAEKISSDKSASAFDCAAFTFFSEVTPDQQKSFISDMGLDLSTVGAVASAFSKLAGYDLPLASQGA